MVVSLLPLPGLSDLNKSFDVDPSPRTTEKAEFFWMNYRNLVPVYKRKGRKVQGWWTFVELDRLDILEDFDIIDHKVYEGKPWLKIKRFRNERTLRNAESWILFEDFVAKEPARAVFYVFQRSLFMIDPAWEIATLFFDDWITLDTNLDTKDVKPNKKPRIFIDEV